MSKAEFEIFMHQKGKWILLVTMLAFLVISVAVYFIFSSNQTPLYFPSQAECEQKTGKPCAFSVCDYRCGFGKYGKGWVPKEY